MFFRRKTNSVNLQKPENSVNKSTEELPKKVALGGETKTTDDVNAGQVENKNIIEILPNPIKSESDKKEYQVIKLRNGLTVTLISDTPNMIDLDSSTIQTARKVGQKSKAKKGLDGEISESAKNAKEMKEKLAACALTVEVGSFSDPEDIQGLAHFLEHMIFMGSKKYPKENKLDAFLSKYGGFQNAFTECEYTSYYFGCPEKQLLKAMDIFAQLFLSPLLKWNAINREREAIEAEFQQAFSDDSARIEQLLCSLATRENPARKFTWGNQHTLWDKVKNNKYLHQSLKEFRKTHYSSDRMRLAIQARLPIDTLRSWVTTCFSTIAKSPNKASELKPNQLFDMERFCRWYFVKSIEDMIKVRISWILPSVLRKYRTKPLDYLAFIIGHEGKGSLLSFLKSKLWALGLSAGYNDGGLTTNDLYTVFSISVRLTDEGRAAIEEVLTATFSYLHMLKETGPDKNLFDEIQSVEETAFRFQEESDAEDNALFVSVAMLLYPPEDYLRGEELLFDYNPEEIMNFLSRMSPSAANIMLLSKNHQAKLDQEEFWFKSRYCSEPISEKWIRKWQNVKSYSEFHLPEKNQFITTDFTVVEHKVFPKYPQKIQVTDSVELWYKGDDKFMLPTAFIGILIITPKIILSPESWVMTSLFVKLLNNQLNEGLYCASTAKLHYALGFVEMGFYMTVYGYNQNLGLLVERLALGLKGFTQNINEKVFLAFQKHLARECYNGTLEASFLANDVLDAARIRPCFTYPEKYAAVKSVLLEQFLEFVETFLDRVHFQALVQGNITEQEGVKIVSKFVGIVEARGSLTTAEFPLERTKMLPKGEKCFRLKTFNLEDKNCVTTVHYQLGRGTISDSVALELFVMIMEEPLFDTLRTKQQLGYEVSASTQETNGILGISITVLSQVSKFSVQQVKDKVDEFVYGFVKNFPKMGSEDFLNYRQSLIDLKNSVDTSLSEEVDRNWGEISKQEFIFDRLEKEMDSISKLDLKSVSSLISKLIAPGTDEHRKLVVQAVGHDAPTKDTTKELAEGNEDDSNLNSPGHELPENIVYSFLASPGSRQGYFVTDLEKWNRSLPEYPPHKITE